MALKVIKFGAVWCGPCQVMDPIFDRVAGSTDGVEFKKVDIDEEPELSVTMNIRSVPTIVFEKDDVAVDSMVGIVREQDLRDRIEEHK
jgi:thioredoxin 1